MNEQIQLLRRYVRMLWPYRWPALALAALVCVIGWAVVLRMPSIYQVDAKIFIDTRSMLRPLLKGLAVDNDTLSSSAMLMKRTLLTRPNLEDVARKTDLDLSTKTAQEFDTLVGKLSEDISLSGTPQDNIYEISYQNANRELAKRVVDELLNAFLETALGANRKDTAATQKFLDEQIQEYEKRLLEAEQRLKEFKQRNAGQMPTEGATYFRELQDARGMVKGAQMELNEAQNRAGALRAQVRAMPEPGSGAAPAATPFVSQYDARITRLHEQLDQLLLQYTDKHPDIAPLRDQLAALEKQRQDEYDAFVAAQKAASEAGAPMPTASAGYNELQLAIAQADAEVSALQARVAFYTKEVAELEKSVDTIPEIEAELTRLNRDYGLNKEQYDELLRRREAARISEDVDQQADDIKLKVIEPPRIPLTPVGPNRVLFMSMVLGGALAAAGGLAFLLSQINPRFYSSEELKELTLLPVLGTVSLVFSARQRTERRMELAVFAMVFVGLLGLYGGLVALELLQYDLSGRLAALVSDSV